MARSRDEAVAEARRLSRLGLPTRTVAAQLGVDHGTVARWLRTSGEGRRRGPRGRVDVPDRRILDLRAESLSYEAIAADVGMSKTGTRMRYYALIGRRRPERE